MERSKFFLCVLCFIVATACGDESSDSKGRSGLAAAESSLLAVDHQANAIQTDELLSLSTTTMTPADIVPSVTISTLPKETFLLEIAPSTTAALTTTTPVQTTVRTRDGKIVTGAMYVSTRNTPASCASYTRHSGSDLSYIEKLFWDCLLRPEALYDDDEWVQKLKAGVSRQQVWRDIYNSLESQCLRGLADCGDMKLTGRFPQFNCNFTKTSVTHPRMKERLVSLCPEVSVSLRR